MEPTSPATLPPRLLVIPGLRDSGPAHWQTWLEGRSQGAVRVVQRDWDTADLRRWGARIDSVLARHGPGPWLAVAHSFGVLALVEHLARVPGSPIAAALLVAPADPARFGLSEAISREPLPVPATVVASLNDPWLPWSEAARWGARWGCPVVNLGAAGHINAESGHGPLALAERWCQTQAERLAAVLAPKPSALAA
ncbi:RBBP9/YdeN family alpha/beta hydrolase [Rubrivivax rivuli]|uniref:Alpha/beta hydrolase n=1 Tax=Rubrivivax rivuli TaxID=1862385 RepID=A0A437RS26_9BURK|nr:alpha/beta hydrolase [Rubrivivax rivuli]RVU49551.1 alpha/beta hydrolase [Rubrivivax rivuli]